MRATHTAALLLQQTINGRGRCASQVLARNRTRHTSAAALASLPLSKCPSRALVAATAPHTARSDSDGDGQSNGFELGDPCCLWTSGAPQFTSDISNPGVFSSKTSRVCNVVCSNGLNPCNLPSPTSPPTSTTPPPPPPPPASSAPPAAPPVQAPCTAHSSCLICTSAPSCGWCSKTLTCKSGAQDGSSDSACLQSASAWTWGAQACDVAVKSGEMRAQ